MVKFQVCTTRVKNFMLNFLLLKPCGALWHPVKTSLAKINLQWSSVSRKLLKTPLHSLKWIIFEGYGVGCSGLGNNFLLFMLKNPRSRSRCMCCYEMKMLRFFDNLFALQKLLLYDQFFLVKYWDLSEKIPFEANSTT